jgi:uncharacterized protein YjdB
MSTPRTWAVLSVLTLWLASLLTACGGATGLEQNSAGAANSSAGGKSGTSKNGAGKSGAGAKPGTGGESGAAENAGAAGAGDEGAGAVANGGSAGSGGANNVGGFSGLGNSAGIGGSTSAAGSAGATNSAGNAGSTNLGGNAGTTNAGGAGNLAGFGGVGNGAGSGGSANAGAAGSGGTTNAALVSVAVTPSIATIAVGTRTLLQATGTYSDGSTRDVTATATWFSNDEAVATIAEGSVDGVDAGIATISATVNGLSGFAEITVSAATVTEVTVTPATATTGIQGTVPFHAVATLSDATTQDVTATATWSASDDTVTSVSSSGVATGLKAGTSDVQASVGMVSGSATLTVTAATLASIAVTPTNPALGTGVTQVFTATGTFSDGSVADVSSNATFGSSDTNVASLDPATHAATTRSAGTTTISATVGAVSGSTTLTVTAATLSVITVTPATSTLAIKGTTALTATGTYSDGTTADITGSVTWSSNNATVASVSNATGSRGTVTGLSGGSATVSATLGNSTGSASITVTPAALVSIGITPADPSLPAGSSTALAAQGTYSDGSSVDVTNMVTWSSDSTGVASVSNATGSQGRVTAVAVGSSTVHATLGAVTAATTVTVTAATLVSIAISPADPSLPAGTSRALVATASYSDGSTADVTTAATWSSNATRVASVSNASGSQGDVTAIVTGTATVTATLNSVSGSTTVTVSAPVVTQVVISPAADSVRVGATVTYSAVAIYSNNTQTTLGRAATWTSSNTAVATLTTGGRGGAGANVVATAVGTGSSTISATYQGVTGSTTLTVTSATVSSIEITPTNPTLSVNGTRQLTATAIYSDATTQDVTAQATWVSNDRTVAPVSTGGGGPGGGGRGNVTAVAAGSATISATLNGLTATTVVTVTSATLVSIELTPVAPSVALGTTVTFTATALYSDNSTQNVTGRATWISSTPRVASISTAGGTRGQALALSAGTTTISATLQGVTGTTTLTVTTATLTSIQITPFAPTIPLGFNTNLTATGIYSDNTTRDLTALATWTSSVTTVAAVSDAAATRGALTPLSAGTTTISATYQGVTGTDSVVISSATLSSISVTPAAATIAVRGTQAFSALGTLSDGSTLDLTNYVTWLSTTPSVASISNAAGSRGLATGLTTGSVTISAVRGSVTGTASLLVQ